MRETISLGVRFSVMKRDHFMCRYCGRRPPQVKLELDHLRPIADGGPSDAENLVTACEDCNAGKGSRPLTLEPTEMMRRRRAGIDLLIEQIEWYGVGADATTVDELIEDLDAVSTLRLSRG